MGGIAFEGFEKFLRPNSLPTEPSGGSIAIMPACPLNSEA